MAQGYVPHIYFNYPKFTNKSNHLFQILDLLLTLQNCKCIKYAYENTVLDMTAKTKVTIALLRFLNDSYMLVSTKLHGIQFYNS